MKDSYEVDLLFLGGVPAGHGSDGVYSIFAKFTAGPKPDIPVCIGGTKPDDIVGFAHIHRRVDNQAIIAKVNFLKAATPYSQVSALWSRGVQLYCNPHMRRSYEFHKDHDTVRSEVITVDVIELQHWNASSPGYTPPLFTWP